MGTRQESGRRGLTGQDAAPHEATGEGGETRAWDRQEDEELPFERAGGEASVRPGGRPAQEELAPGEEPRVDHMMTRDPIVITPDARLEQAAAQMAEASVRHLPVVDADGRLVGILSDRDLRQTLGTDTHQWYRAAVDSLSETVENVMSPEPLALPLGTGLEAALELFADEGVGAIPIVDEGERVVGMLSYVDVLTWLERRLSRRPEDEAQPSV